MISLVQRQPFRGAQQTNLPRARRTRLSCLQGLCSISAHKLTRTNTNSAYPCNSRQTTALNATSVDSQPMDTPAAAASCGVLIVGGGPSGFTTAIMLAQQGFTDIRVLERGPSPEAYDPNRAFMYSIFPWGKQVLRDLGVTSIEAEGLAINGLACKYIQPDRKEKNVHFFKRPDHEFKETDANSWIPRHTLTRLLYEHLTEHFSESVQVQFNSAVTDVRLPIGATASRITVKSKGTESEKEEAWACKLLVAGDGADSLVRGVLEAAQPREAWHMEERPSDSGNLAYKVLSLPPNPRLASYAAALSNPDPYVCPGVSVDGAFPLRLGLLPLKDPTQPRSANFVLRPSHPFWNVSTKEQVYEYLERAFPQLDKLREVVTEDAVGAFVAARRGRFRNPQFCGRLVASFAPPAEGESEGNGSSGGQEDAAAKMNGSAVLLLGDAAHVFPPDLGQGVNSAILDVATVKECLQAHPADVLGALAEYERLRVPENKALIRLQQIGLPYQYKQEGTQVQQTLHSWNTLLRLVLSKVAPSLFSPQVGLQIANMPASTNLYQDVLKRSNRTTVNLGVAAALLLAVVTMKIMGA